MPFACTQSIKYSDSHILCVSASPCERFIACGSGEGLAVWDDFDKDPIVVLFPCGVSSVLWIDSEESAWCLVCGLESGRLIAVDWVRFCFLSRICMTLEIVPCRILENSRLSNCKPTNPRSPPWRKILSVVGLLPVPKGMDALFGRLSLPVAFSGVLEIGN